MAHSAYVMLNSVSGRCDPEEIKGLLEHPDPNAF